MSGEADPAPGAADPGRVEVAIVVPLRGGRVLVARRTADQHLANLWEFPGGKLEFGETPPEAAQRELREETGLEAGRLDPLVVFVHDYADRPLRLHVFLAVDPRGGVKMDAIREWSWVTPEDLVGLDLPPANRAILRALHWRLSGRRTDSAS